MRARRIAVLLLRRLLFMIPILFGVITVTFFVTRLAGGDPAYLIAGAFATPEVIAEIQAQIGTDKSIGQQYVNFLSGAVRLDFGEAIFTGNPVQDDLGARLPATIELVAFSLALGLILGVSSGVFAARRRGRKSDKTVNATSFSLLSLPDFWFGLILLYVFFFKLSWAPPPVGQLSANDPSPTDITGAAVLDSIITANPAALKAAVGHAALPVVTLGVLLAAPISRLTRSSMLEVLQADYMQFGQACGFPKSRLRRYSVRAALPPVVTLAGIIFSILIGGAVLVEVIFSWGGAAQYAATAIIQSDYPAIQAFVFVAGAISVFVFLVVDLLYVLIDPRVKL